MIRLENDIGHNHQDDTGGSCALYDFHRIDAGKACDQNHAACQGRGRTADAASDSSEHTQIRDGHTEGGGMRCDRFVKGKGCCVARTRQNT